MVKITITHENGTSYTYEDVVAFDFYDKEFCESVAKRPMTNEELEEVRDRMDDTEDVTCETVSQTINDVLEELNDSCIPF